MTKLPIFTLKLDKVALLVSDPPHGHYKFQFHSKRLRQGSISQILEEDSLGPDKLLDNAVCRTAMSTTNVSGKPHISTMMHFWKPVGQWSPRSTMALIKSAMVPKKQPLTSFLILHSWSTKPLYGAPLNHLTLMNSVLLYKLDGVGQFITDPPPNNFFLLTCDKWHVTRDTWHMTHDMWQVTHDMWQGTHMVWWTVYKNVRSLALTAWKLWRFEDWEEKDDLINYLLNDKGVCRTAPATPGLIIIVLFFVVKLTV